MESKFGLSSGEKLTVSIETEEDTMSEGSIPIYSDIIDECFLIFKLRLKELEKIKKQETEETLKEEAK